MPRYASLSSSAWSMRRLALAREVQQQRDERHGRTDGAARSGRRERERQSGRCERRVDGEHPDEELEQRSQADAVTERAADPDHGEVEGELRCERADDRWARRACAPGRRPRGRARAPARTSARRWRAASRSGRASRGESGRGDRRRRVPRRPGRARRRPGARRASAPAPAPSGSRRPCRSRTRRARPRRTPRRRAARRGSRTSARCAGRRHTAPRRDERHAERAEGQRARGARAGRACGRGPPGRARLRPGSSSVTRLPPYGSVRAVFPSIQGSPSGRFSTPKGDATRYLEHPGCGACSAAPDHRSRAVQGSATPDGDRGPNRIRDLDKLEERIRDPEAWPARQRICPRRLDHRREPQVPTSPRLCSAVTAAPRRSRSHPGTTRLRTTSPATAASSRPEAGRLSGGAAVVAGNESFYVHGKQDHSALLLPTGATATSAPALLRSAEPRHPVLRDEPDRVRHRQGAGRSRTACSAPWRRSTAAPSAPARHGHRRPSSARRSAS